MDRKLGIALLGVGALLFTAAALAAVASTSDTSGEPALVEAQVRNGLAAAPVETSKSAGEIPIDGTRAPAQATTSPEAAPAEAGDAEAPTAHVPVPVGLRIGSIAVDAPVDPYGVDQRTRQMAVPDNVTDVAWYKFGPSPGEPGSAVLAAHVDLFGQGPGVFFDLRSLEVDDLVHVELSDGSEHAFRIVARTVYEKEDLPTDVIFAKQGPAVLTLITCGGGFSESDRSYDSNVVVYAVPLVDGASASGIPG